MTLGPAKGAAIARKRPVIRQNRLLSERDVKPTLNCENSYGSKRRVGLLGGSFNPAHEGHRAISLEAVRRLRLDQVWWLVSPQNPLKSRRGMADLKSRMASAKAIASSHPAIVVTDLEQKIGTQYTVDTVRRLKRNRTCDFVWLIGADNLMQLPAWREWRALLNLVPIAVFDREPYSYKALAGQVATIYAHDRVRSRHAADLVRTDPPAWVYFRLRRHRVSSTAIRGRQEWPTDIEVGSTMSAGSGSTEGMSS
jgi:nicotinate-nucleotide adenylyltransferase